MSATVTTLPPAPCEQDIPAGFVGSVELVQRAGISYRQCDYWKRVGYLVPAARPAGSGYPCHYPASEVPVAALMGRLIAGGLNPRRAHTAARELLATGHTTIAGIRIELPEEA